MGRPQLKKQEPQINYDDFSDVLYISFGKPSPGLSDEISDGNFIRINPYTDEVVGITIVDFKEQYTIRPDKNIKEFAISLIPEILKTANIIIAR